MTSNCAVCSAFKSNEYILHSGVYWTVSLADDQYWLGRSYVTLNDHKSSLSELDNEEWLEFATIVNKYELKIKKVYRAELFNWSSLMNDAFKHIPYNSPHVHWHVRPRYSKIIKKLDVEFIDSEFGKHYKTRWDGREDFVVSNILMKKIQKTIKF